MQTELLDDLHSMQSDFAAHRAESGLRHRLQNYFDTLHTRETAEGATPHLFAARIGGLRLLRAMQNAALPQQAAPCFSVSLSALCENAAFCGDLLCRAAEKRIFFSGDTGVLAACRPHAVLQALLNLLSNALEHSAGRYIFLETSYIGAQAALTVASEGAFSVPAFFAAQTKIGGGLWFAAKTARLHKGGLYLVPSDGFSAVTLSFPAVSPDLPGWTVPDFTDWLADELSPIYTLLCDSIFGSSTHFQIPPDFG